jgi:GNAT superfamily N-acetyltransferase
MLDRVLDATHATQRGVLDRRAYGRFCEAQAKTAWGSRFQRRLALVDGGDLLASAEQYDLAGTCDGRAVRICGIGSLVTNPARRGRGHARVLLEALLDRATGGRAEMALLFTHAGLDDDVREGFEALPMTEVTLEVAQSPRHGAPMTMVRGGGERDLAAIVSMGRVRVGPLRFHLDREIDLVRFALTRKRLIAGLGPAGARQLHFFIVEEGITAAAYVIVSAAGGTWTLEECGDRDASGAGRRPAAGPDCPGARRASSGDPRVAPPGLPAAAAHNPRGGSGNRGGDDQKARYGDATAAPIEQRRAVLAQRRLLTRPT